MNVSQTPGRGLILSLSIEIISQYFVRGYRSGLVFGLSDESLDVDFDWGVAPLRGDSDPLWREHPPNR